MIYPGRWAKEVYARPRRLFLSAIFGGDTLTELRIACALAETENEGGVSARVSPLAHVRDAGNLLGRAGLQLPAVDIDTLTLNYKTPMDLVEHLRMMGEQNAVIERRQTIKRSTMELANQKYVENFSALSLSKVDVRFAVETIIERKRDLGYVSNFIHDGMVSFRDATKSEGERICDGEFERLEIRVGREGGGRGEEVEIVVVVVV